MHIYAFGSVCRGDVSLNSDVDLLAIVDGFDCRFNPNVYSIYSCNRMQELWKEGHPFAWHLSLESRLIFSSDQEDFLATLGSPAPYKNCINDCEKFFNLFYDAHVSITAGSASMIFDLSTVFLSIRNIATCFSLGMTKKPDFSRHSALRIGTNSIPIPETAYQTLERARILCTRGHGTRILDKEVSAAILHLGEVDIWMKYLLEKVRRYERI